MIGYPEQTRLTEYIHYRLAQLEEEARIIDAFQAKHTVNPRREIYDLNNVLRELETSNDGETKERNVRYLIPRLFYLDLGAILSGQELLPLPDSLLEIQSYLDELERQRVETEKRLQREREIQEAKRALEISRQRQAAEKARKQEELCEMLGISPRALAKLQGGE